MFLGSIGETSNVSDDDCEGEECEVERIPMHLIITCNLVLVPLEGTWNEVHVMCPSLWVCWCILRNICKLCMQMNLTKDWVCNFKNGILSQGLFTIAYIYKC
jgi:hypothetical protein